MTVILMNTYTLRRVRVSGRYFHIVPIYLPCKNICVYSHKELIPYKRGSIYGTKTYTHSQNLADYKMYKKNTLIPTM